MKQKTVILGVLLSFLLSVSLYSPLPALGDEIFTEELEWTVGDTWNYQVTLQSGRILRVSHEIIDEGTRLIDNLFYDVYIINVSGIIETMGYLPGDIEQADLLTSSVTGTIYHSKDDTAQKVMMNMTAELKDPSGTLYTYSVSDEHIQRITKGSPPGAIDVGTTWNITRIEKETRVTSISGGHYGTGDPVTTTTTKTANLTNMCTGKENRMVAQENFSVYKIRRTETQNPGNYSLYYLSPKIKREILLLEFRSIDPIHLHQYTELLPGYTITPAPLSLTALFTWDPPTPGIHETVTLNASRSSDPHGNITDYSWSYTPSDSPHLPVAMGTGALLSYNWSHAGLYNITLQIKNTRNETDTQTISLQVLANNPPVAVFIYTPLHPSINDQVTFDASSSYDSDGKIASYAWDWETDGVFANPVYTATDHHHWITPGTYTVTLQVTDDNGGSATTTHTITITDSSLPSTNRPPRAEFTYSPQDPTDLDPISFTDTSLDPDGWIVDWRWNFGDGGTSTTQHPSHHYTHNGIYTIRLTVTDNMDTTHITSQDITIRNVPPAASFTTHPSPPLTTNTPVTFNSTSTDPDGTIINWTWNLEENLTLYGDTITHTYPHDGSFNITLTIRDDDGDTDILAHTLILQKKDTGNSTPGFGVLIILTSTTLALFLRKKHRL